MFGRKSRRKFSSESNVPKNVSNMRLLTMKCWPHVKQMLQDSKPVTHVAKYIQSDCGELTELTFGTLVHSIHKLVRDSDESYIRDQAVQGHIPLIQSMTERADAYDAYQVLLGIQFERVMIGFLKERRDSKLNRDSNDAVRILNDVIESMSKIDPKKFQVEKVIDTPSADSSAEKMKKMYEEKFGSIAANILSNPDSRRRWMNFAEMLKSATTGDLAEILTQRKNGDTSQ